MFGTSHLTCDSSNGCGHRIEIATPQSWEDLRQHIGTRCPKCGNDMLTEAAAKAGWEFLSEYMPKLSALAALGLIKPLAPGEEINSGETLIKTTIVTTPEGGLKLRNASLETKE